MSAKPASACARPADQAVRDRFIRETDRNFSVIAPAGTGKTKALVDRIVSIAMGPFETACEQLPQLVVVTYTNKAANEMHQRARNEIILQGGELAVLSRFNRAFFGTIHSFCLSLLRDHGHLLGLPGQLDVPPDEDRLWMEFVQQTTALGGRIPPQLKTQCLRYVRLDDLLSLARQMPPGVQPPLPADEPIVDLSPLLSFAPNGKTRVSVDEAKRILRRWDNERQRKGGFAPLPSYEKGGQDFLKLWQQTFAPMKDWLSQCALCLVAEIADDYQAYRRKRGELTFDDQVELALELVRHPEAGRRIREAGYRVILDEAQDTDPRQFDVLLEVARPPEATGRWLESGGPPPRAGHFCMVGDPQQSIYGSRADLARYLEVQDKLAAAGAAEKLTFQVTFRCQSQIVAVVNNLAEGMLDGRHGQASFVTLQKRPNAGPGRVLRWVPDLSGLADEELTEPRTQREADQLAAWLAQQGPGGLDAPAWSEVAILLPRIAWFGPFRRALERRGIPVQIHSQDDIMGDDPAVAWFTALMVIAAEPDNAFEIVGVLREIFGCSDHELAVFCAGDSSRFQILRPTGLTTGPARLLDRLVDARRTAYALPLRDAAESMVQAARLREKLAVLPGGATAESLARLESLLTRASLAEQDGLVLGEWVEQLKLMFHERAESDPARPDAIQLITCHKSKGLQWHAVILPLLYRIIMDASVTYPLVTQAKRTQPAQVVFNKDDWAEGQKERNQSKCQELQRLLYVAMTRARETLVLVDDKDLFKKDRPFSFADVMGLCKGVCPPAWTGLPTAAELGPGASRLPATPAPKLPAAPAVASGVPEAARERARQFAHRILPHALAHYAPDGEPEARWSAAEDDGAPAGRDAAAAYGDWWHQLMECLPWPVAVASQAALFEERLADCPAPERARREWALLLASDIAGRLAFARLVVHVEMPFLVPGKEDQCVEGLMDLAALDPGARHWLLLDWKTNLIAAGQADYLREMYRPQIQAYAEALRAITGGCVEAGLYSTPLGLWLPYV